MGGHKLPMPAPRAHAVTRLRWMVGAVFAAASLAGGILAALLRLAG